MQANAFFVDDTHQTCNIDGPAVQVCDVVDVPLYRTWQFVGRMYMPGSVSQITTGDVTGIFRI